MAIIVYSTPTCPFCKMAKEFLTEKGADFEDFNVVEDDEKREEMVKKSGQMGVPVIDVNGKILVGFEKGELEKALGDEDE